MIRPLRFVVAAALVLAHCEPLIAACSISSCTMDADRPARPKPGRARLDLSLQYSDADAPWSLSRRAVVGQVPNPEHDEVRTISRAWTARFDYDFARRWGAGVTVPFVSRGHEHIETATGERESTGASGVGDLGLELRWTALPARDGGPSLVLSLAGEFPTGGSGSHRHGAAAHQVEPPLRPGSGSYDAVVGLVAAVPLAKLSDRGERSDLMGVARASYRRNGAGWNGYGLGDQWDASVGVDAPVLSRFDLTARADWRARRRDDAGRTGQPVEFTGGEQIFLTPGFRVRLFRGVSSYAQLQLPVYRRFNRLQLTAERQWLFGVAWEFEAPALF